MERLGKSLPAARAGKVNVLRAEESQESVTLLLDRGNFNKQGGHPMPFLVSPKDSPLARFRFVKEMRW